MCIPLTLILFVYEVFSFALCLALFHFDVAAFKGISIRSSESFLEEILGSLDIFSVWSPWYVVEYVANDFSYSGRFFFPSFVPISLVHFCSCSCATSLAYRIVLPCSFACTTLSVKVFAEATSTIVFKRFTYMEIAVIKPWNESYIIYFGWCWILAHSFHSLVPFTWHGVFFFSCCCCCFFYSF